MIMKTPSAKKMEKELVEHGHTRVDNYYWIRLSDEQKNAATPDEQTADVLAYLKEENEYVDAGMKHTEELQKQLFEEMKGRIKEDDSSVPVKQTDIGITRVLKLDKTTPSTAERKTAWKPEKKKFSSTVQKWEKVKTTGH